ncbi:MAG: WhiB family transcriptional regulator [Dermatophilaceae bacterium]
MTNRSTARLLESRDWADGSPGKWRLFAACKNMPTDAWFPVQGNPPDWVVETCRTCPVRRACAEYAIGHERLGYWGGLSANERISIRRRRLAPAAAELEEIA